MNNSTQRYHGFAISLHWLIAILIIGMLVVGKYMVSLDKSEPLRFLLTQWHKSFGIVALVLIFIRVLWRLTHRPPRLPGHLKPWEIQVAGLAHILLYLLIILIPISGWIMVSASPLDLPTLVFNSIHWPHLAPLDTLPGKADISSLFLEVHTVAGSLLILLLVAHVGAALRHQFVLHDDVMNRMSLKMPDGKWATGIIPLTSTIILVVVGLIVYGYSGGNSVPLSAGKSSVQFAFTVQNQTAEGLFPESTVELLLDTENPTANTLDATVTTATITTGNSQIDSTLLGSDWFDVKNHPQASFASRELVPVGEGSYAATGTLRIKGISRELTFPLNLAHEENKSMATGSFTIDRLDFDLGKNSQPDEETVGYQIVVEFEFEIQ
jgi:cytochrome b561